YRTQGGLPCARADGRVRRAADLRDRDGPDVRLCPRSIAPGGCRGPPIRTQGHVPDVGPRHRSAERRRSAGIAGADDSAAGYATKPDAGDVRALAVNPA